MSASPTPTHTSSAAETDSPVINFEKHLRWFAPLMVVILIAATLFIWKQSRETNLRTEVLNAYSQADSAEALAAISEVYTDQPEAPLALLQAASLHYNDGDIESAQELYTRFQTLYPSHAMIEHATWGIWMSAEALGELDAALQGFQAITEEQVLYPQALLGQARIHEKQSNAEEALAIYDQIQKEFPESAWAEQARVFSDQLSMQQRRP
ncbi:MAG: tetratricopeptide repeat protein [Kiritimatiellae bacterium]|jgi:TolA-binding protein|nr:tetratricopeptide repeat protein [Kiritimatiellia bacterium]